MSIALQNQVDELEIKVKKLIEQVEQHNRMLKPITADTVEHPRRGRPPKVQGHMQP